MIEVISEQFKIRSKSHVHEHLIIQNTFRGICTSLFSLTTDYLMYSGMLIITFRQNLHFTCCVQIQKRMRSST